MSSQPQVLEYSNYDVDETSIGDADLADVGTTGAPPSRPLPSPGAAKARALEPMDNNQEAIEVMPELGVDINRSKRRFRNSFVMVGKFEGTVLSVGEDSFWARLTDKASTELPREVEVLTDRIRQADQELLVPGAAFYWFFGYEDAPSGRRSESIIKLRRFPNWTDFEIRRGKQRAEQLYSKFSQSGRKFNPEIK